jgi:hypothetical protein
MTIHLELRMGTLVSLLLLSVGPTAHPFVKCVPTEPIYAEAPLDRNAGALKGQFYVNPNRTIWALAVGNLVAHKAYKIPWLRPDGQTLTVMGKRLDGVGQKLRVRIPCCYSSAFQAVRIEFPSAGCWEITAKAGREELVFVVVVRNPDSD